MLNNIVENSTDNRIIKNSGIILSFLLVILIYRLAFFSALDNRYYDYIQTLLKDSHKPLPIIVDIDEKSLNTIGQWPWPRYRIAQILENLYLEGASSVSLDIIFAEPDRSSLVEINNDLTDSFNYSLNLSDVPEEYHDNDKALAKICSMGKTIVSYKFHSSQAETGSNYLYPIDATLIQHAKTSDRKFQPFSGKNVSGPIKVLADSSVH